LNQIGRLHRENPSRPAAIVSGGELSCPVPGATRDPSRARQQADNPSRDRKGAEVPDVVPWASPSGIGGRNQAFALYCATKIAGKRLAVLSAGTDGIDGNSPAAGALADGSTTGRAAAQKLDPEAFLHRSDSHTFFAKLNDAIQTGPTGTNVRDLRVVLAYG
jgi:glycerate-2-kinase